MKKVTAGLALLVLLTSCGRYPHTRLEGCQETGTAMCFKASACGLLRASQSKCLSDFVQGCCASGGCGSSLSDATSEAYVRCSAALERMTCSQTEMATRGEGLPLQCT